MSTTSFAQLAVALLASLACTQPAGAQSPQAQGKPTPVTIDNFTRAETHRYFKERVDAGCFGRICNERKPRGVDEQAVIRLNRDTVYSSGVFDLASPATLVLPEPHGRFQSVLLISEDHYNRILPYGPATITLTQEMAGSRYAMLAFRTFLDPNDPQDIARAHQLQDAIQVRQEKTGTFEIPDWDQQQLEEVRNGLLKLAPFNTNPKGRFGPKGEVDPVRHLIGTATGWGGNPPEAAMYLNAFPARNDGQTPYVLKVRDVPVDGFWSVTVYNAQGFYEAPESAISVNNVTAARDADGGTTIHFGGDPKAPNYLRIMPGWNYVVRLYRPRQDLLDGAWRFPEAQPVR